VQESWEGELIGQFPPAGTMLEPGDRVRLFVSHPALGDRLPEGFVAATKREGERDPQSVEDWSHEVFRERLEVARREEPPAMRLLRVAEAALWRPRLESRLRLGGFEGIGEDLPLAEQLLGWLRRRPDGVAVDRLRWLGNSLWVLGQATGPEAYAARLLERLVGLAVRMRRGRAAPVPLREHQITRLGSSACALGCGALLGERLDDRRESVEVVVGPLSAQEAAEQVRSPERRRMFHNWAEALLPVSRPWKVRYEVEGAHAALGKSEPCSVLGVTAVLGASA
jgi:hypothetical protein